MLVLDKVRSSQHNTPPTPKEKQMKTEFNRSNKDNIANTAVIAASLFALAGALFTSTSATAAATPAVQKMDAIVVTAKRLPAATVVATPVRGARAA